MKRPFGAKITTVFVMTVLLIGTFSQSYAVSPNSNHNNSNLGTDLPVIESNPRQQGISFAPNQVIVKFKQDVSDESIQDFYDDFHGKFGLEEKRDLSPGNDKAPKTKLAKTTTQVNQKMIEKLQSDPRVEFAEPDYVLSIDTSDKYYHLLWGLENTGQEILGSTGTYDVDIDAPEAWDKLPNTPTKVIVGVIDSGVNYAHEDLAAHMWINPGEIQGNGIDDDNNGYVDDIYGIDTHNNDSDPMDDNGHGSHVAGTIGAAENGLGIVGVSQHVEIIACKFLDENGSGYTSDAVDCFNYFKESVSNVLVTNNSWGGGSYSQSLSDAMWGGDGSTLHVTAAGNGNFVGKPINIDSKAHYPASYDLDNIIVVAATDFNDKYASFSNYGYIVDIGAPGVNIASAHLNDDYYYMSGTSMATPHVTGAAALAWNANPNLSVQEVKELIRTTGDYIPPGRQFTGTDSRLNVNNMLSTITQNLGPITDIAISSITAPSSVVQGDGASIQVTVSNTGNQDVTTDIVVGLNDDTTNTSIGSQIISGGLAAGEPAVLQFNWDTDGATLGTHTITANHAFTDDDPSNDSGSADVLVESAITDIAISSITAPSSVVQGDGASIQVTVSNTGNQDVTTDIVVGLNDDTTNTSIGSQTISGGLAAGEPAVLQFNWDTAGATLETHTITASHGYADNDSTNDSKSGTITVSEPVTSVIAQVSYSTEGGKNGDKHLNGQIFVDLVGASVTFTVEHNGAPISGLDDVTLTSGDGGTVGFSYKNSLGGTYTTNVTAIMYDGVYLDVTTWDNYPHDYDFSK